MDTFWNCVILFFAIFGGIAFVIFFCGFFDDRKRSKKERKELTKLLFERVETLELGRGSLVLDMKEQVRVLEGKLGRRLDQLQKTIELLEKTAVLKENRYINKPRSYGANIHYGLLHDLISDEQAVRQMQEQREKAIRDGFTLIHTHSDGSETWVKKDKGKKK